MNGFIPATPASASVNLIHPSQRVSAWSSNPHPKKKKTTTPAAGIAVFLLLQLSNSLQNGLNIAIKSRRPDNAPLAMTDSQ